jgi:mycothiol synthase
MSTAAGADGSPTAADRLGDWSRPEDDQQVDAARALLAAVSAADAVSAVSGHVLEAIEHRTARWLLVRNPSDGALIGLAVALAGDPAEVAVHPGHRRLGWGSALVSASIRRQQRVWAYGDLPAAQALARKLQLRPACVLLQLRRALPLEAGVAVLQPAPEGVRIRPYRPADDEAIVAVNSRAFAWHPEQGRMTLEDLRQQMAEDWFDPAGLFVAVTYDETLSDEKVLGFHWTKVHPDQLGEVYVLAVDPDSGVRRLGAPLTRAGLDHLAAAGQHEVMLYVEGDNERARRLYERIGFRTALTSVVYG